MTRIERNGNYIKLTDENGLIDRYPADNVYFRNEIGDTFAFNHKYNHQLIKSYQFSELLDENGDAWADKATLIEWLEKNTGSDNSTEESINVSVNANELGFDAWGRNKVVIDRSIIHGMFTFNVPVLTWYETNNDVIQTTFNNCTSVDGELVVEAGATLNDKTYLRTFRNPRYEPNRGALYSTAGFIDNPSASMKRRWGTFTDEAGVFFELDNGLLYGVTRTTRGGTTINDRTLFDTTDIDLSKGNIYDIQYQWRGVGNYKFFINIENKQSFQYLGTLTNVSIHNPALPIAFESVNEGDNDTMRFGCVDVTSEGGMHNGSTYGSISTDTQTGSVAINGYNQPIIAARSKTTFNGAINTRDTLALLASAYGDQRAVFRVWATRDFTAITDNDQVWRDFGDGHMEYLVYDNPDVTTPMTFDTTKAELIFSCRVDQDQTYSTSALFEGRTDIWKTPGDMFVFTMHRETGQSMTGGVTYEFAEQI